MKFTLAWSEVLSQNSILKILLLALTSLCLVLASGLILISEKDPLIIERACYSSLLGRGDTAPTNSEVKAFINEALSQRFDSHFISHPTFLSTEEKVKAQKEREEMTAKKMRQRIIINGLNVTADKITVDSDRLISVDNVRTAFRFPLEVKLATVPRTDQNPYGLILQSVSELPNQGKQ
jgi:hypothetical protein